ncbi:TIGR01777 family oxidoreductase [Corynebacterium sp.]|uniref:TIGR01777 family oxidoreductase n=1 Tax=Corynebacterium sp. TaxID=1720 RepID=UPI0026DA9E42|nr:TIGR01777 family oxidoreductase [Corynebacterium sp.]MDO5077986.1 TIGR01777 family oxidoreductase [Corynebacterium sp.]
MLTYEYADEFPWARESVSAYYESPGAIVRLSPEWSACVVQEPTQGLRVGSRSELVLRPAWLSMLSGRALPGLLRPGVRWVAEHIEYEQGRRFVDHMVEGPFADWRHEHVFVGLGGGAAEPRCQASDRIEFDLPEVGPRQNTRAGVALTSMIFNELDRVFAYRSAQTRADLEFQAWLRAVTGAEAAAEPAKTIAISGATGLVGTALSAFLRALGHRVVALTRNPPKAAVPGVEFVSWNPEKHELDPEKLLGVDAVVNLAGASILGPFTQQHKRAIYQSRRDATWTLVEAMKAVRKDGGPQALISASASGFYGHDAGEVSESGARGDDFLATVCQEWEASALRAQQFDIRVALVRTGLVLSARGGLLAAQMPLYLAGLGGPLGGGTSWMPWISLEDMVRVYAFAALHSEVSGPINAAAPHPVQQREFAKTLGRVVHRPARVPTPGFVPSLVLGQQGARELALSSAQLVPDVLIEHGFEFRFPRLESALRHSLGRSTAN